jgi:[ribosomal protein S5]-alanine N-acetyltransferase
MVLIPGLSRAEEGPRLAGARTILRYPAAGDYESWAALREASRAFLTPWEPIWPADDLSRPAWRRRLRRYQRDVKEDRAYAFFVFERETMALVGGLTLSNVRRGVSQSASLGYWAGERFAGKRLISDAVRTLLPWAFGALGLHRVEAACIEDNMPSRRVLTACGFRFEGQARAYLRIAGEWRDHMLFALLDDDPR